MSLEVKIIKQQNFTYLAELTGSLDSDTYKQFEDELKEIIDDKTKAVKIDMKELTYISSAGIGIVMWAKKALKSKGATFALVNLQPQIEKVFEAMKVLPVVDIFQNMPEADMYIDQIIKEEIDKQNA